MLLLYNFGIYVLRVLYRVTALVNHKAQAFNQGRRQQADKLKTTFPLPSSRKVIWFHCSSLGEFEQGRPVIEAIKKWKPELKILLTFFSPSGYEVRKNYEYADFVYYLPWDTARNAKWFVENVMPSLVIFVKYEFWYHYTTALHQQNIPLISISSIFRPNQVFFKIHGAFFRRILKNFTCFFVQNQSSVELLRSIGITSVSQAGDTRFDRVYLIAQSAEENPVARHFKENEKLMVVGSAWPEDMEVLAPFINEKKGILKFIVAPHEISEDFLLAIEKAIQGEVIRYSAFQKTSSKKASVLLIDNVGLLSGLYQYGDMAYVGGAFGHGLHNILEAACFGIPIFFGDKGNEKYQEAVDLVALGGAFEIGNSAMLKSKYERLVTDPEKFRNACDITRQYVVDNTGATDKIVTYFKKILE